MYAFLYALQTSKNFKPVSPSCLSKCSFFLGVSLCL